MERRRLLSSQSWAWEGFLTWRSKRGGEVRKTKEIEKKTKTGLIVAAYEGMLFNLRRKERHM